VCGFVGIHRFDGATVSGATLDALARTIGHRGPDGDGVWTGRTAGLAHRRLAIIDPTGSPQPMASSDGTVHVAFNGEILNYRELRRRLLPYPFRTGGDTEVLLALHRARGMAGLSSLRGQYAYALHDEVANETWLVRDRLGILPLYYVRTPAWVAFASEAKALLPLLDDIAVDEDSLDAYLRRRAVPAPATLLRNVRKLPPGHIAHIAGDGSFRVTPYWSLDEVSERDVDDDEAVTLVRDALGAAVDENLVADVPVGAYLSGGLDSSLIAAFAAARSTPGTMHTFSAGFGDDRADELPFARQVSTALGTMHHEVHVGPAEFEARWRSLTWFRDAPLSEPADVAVHLLAVAASEHVKVVLSGEGADEIFAGYPKHRFARVSRMPWPAPARLGLDAVQRALPPRLARARIAMRAMSAGTPEERAEAWFAPFTARERAALLGHTGAASHRVPSGGSGSALRQMVAADCGPWLADNLLERGDRMTMAASVELRPPFLDHRLVELGTSLPDRMKVRHGRGKWVLRQVARGQIPASVIDRPKVGFRVPLDRWFREGLQEYARDLLLARGSFVTEVFDRRAVEHVLDRHERRRSDEHIRIWTLLGLEIWHDVTVRAGTPGVASRIASRR
jgi:asparagine synthase (glutamine-hydrolysing)